MSKLCEQLCPEAYENTDANEPIWKECDRSERRYQNAKKAAHAVPQQYVQSVKVSTKPLSMKGYAIFLHTTYGWDVGRNRLFQLFRELGVLEENRMPRKEYLENGMFVYRYSDTRSYAGSVPVLYITPKGQQYFYEDVRAAFAA